MGFKCPVQNVAIGRTRPQYGRKSHAAHDGTSAQRPAPHEIMTLTMIRIPYHLVSIGWPSR